MRRNYKLKLPKQRNGLLDSLSPKLLIKSKQKKDEQISKKLIGAQNMQHADHTNMYQKHKKLKSQLSSILLLS